MANRLIHTLNARSGAHVAITASFNDGRSLTLAIAHFDPRGGGTPWRPLALTVGAPARLELWLPSGPNGENIFALDNIQLGADSAAAAGLRLIVAPGDASAEIAEELASGDVRQHWDDDALMGLTIEVSGASSHKSGGGGMFSMQVEEVASTETYQYKAGTQQPSLVAFFTPTGEARPPSTTFIKAAAEGLVETVPIAWRDDVAGRPLGLIDLSLFIKAGVQEGDTLTLSWQQASTQGDASEQETVTYAPSVEAGPDIVKPRFAGKRWDGSARFFATIALNAKDDFSADGDWEIR